MSSTEQKRLEEQLLIQAVVRLRTGLMALTLGMAAGACLFLATIWLVVRGGPQVGKHLILLRYYFPGYSVSWTGAFIGFLYAAGTGAVLGGLVAYLYNSALFLSKNHRDRGP